MEPANDCALLGVSTTVADLSGSVGFVDYAYPTTGSGSGAYGLLLNYYEGAFTTRGGTVSGWYLNQPAYDALLAGSPVSFDGSTFSYTLYYGL